MDRNRLKAVNFLVIASILWSIAGFLIKLIDLNAMAIAGFRSGIAAIIIFMYMKMIIPGKWKTKLTKIKLLGACSYAANSLLFILANKLTTSANAILLQFTAPIWVALFCSWFLKEKVRKSDWAAIFAVMFGMLLFFIGDLKTGHIIGNIISIISGIGMAGFVILAKLETEDEPVELVLIGNIINFVICLPFCFGSLSYITADSVLLLIIFGVFQLGIPYILYTEAIKHVSSLEAILITVLEPLLNPVWVYIIADEPPGILAVIGGSIVILAVLIRGIYQTKVKNQALNL